MKGLPALLHRLLAPLSPRRRRWQRFLRELPLDPEALPRPLAAPGSRDFVVCGSPRTGTTLLAAALFQPPTCLTVMEPWDGMRMPPARLFASLREELGETGRLRRGKLDVVALLRNGTVRWWPEGRTTPRLEYRPTSLLGVKWPAYWRYLELLPETRFLVCLRHPVDTIASYRNRGGRLGAGLEYDTAFNRRLNRELRLAADTPALRRVLFYDAIHRAILPHLERPNVLTVRFERWFDDPEALVDEIGAFLGVRLNPPPVRIREPRGRSELPPEELALVVEHCTMARALGYSLKHLPPSSAPGRDPKPEKGIP